MGITTRLSIGEYLSYQAPPGFRDELIEGEIVLSPEPKPLHADVARQLEAILTSAVQGTSLLVRQRINVLIKEEVESMPSPDVLIMDKMRWSEARAHNRYPVGGPHLAIEIQSPSKEDRAVLAEWLVRRLGCLPTEADSGAVHRYGRNGIPCG